MDERMEAFARSDHDRSEVVLVGGILLGGVWMMASKGLGASWGVATAPMFWLFGVAMVAYGIRFLNRGIGLGTVEDRSDAGLVHGRGVRRYSFVLGAVLFLAVGIGCCLAGGWLLLDALGLEYAAGP